MTKFVNRENELKFLDKKFSSEDFEMILVYGRRRVGKTELVKHASTNQRSIYHLVVEEEASKQLESLVETVSNEISDYQPNIQKWEEFFEYFCEKTDDTVLIIDEFPRLIKEDSSIPSRFQKFADEYLKTTKNKLVLTGSSISMMEDLMAYENPLYGRRTGQIDLKPFSFRNARKMISRDIKQQIKFYSIFGTTPFYLQQINSEKTLKENIAEQICSENSILNQEPRILVKQEFRKPGRYLSILESIASGKTRPKTISDDTDIPLQSIPKYLNQLKSLRLIKHEKPVTDRNKRSRNGIHQISDNFFDFWFGHIYPHMSDAVENPENFAEKNLSSLEAFYGKKFEQVCREAVSKSTDFGKVGRWWYKEDEIDIVGLNEKEDRIVFGECKWTEKKVGTKVFEDLQDTSEKVRWHNKSRKEEYLLFSKKGFTAKLEQRAEKDNQLQLFDLNELEKIF